ncbi:hypothetical protein [Vibrio tasmaniensis]|uniref:hypothetical protein n=1 Tax=Vibrio tasmaniensis TaxID=212663 RepID=UPI0010801C2F|nr:hypothetical protein [Vibrio tasmaniensis]
MSSKVIFHKVRGRDNEEYIFLDRNEDNGTYQVRVGTSTSVDYFNWADDSSTFTVDEFLANNDSYSEKVQQLIAEFEAEV